jgi:voltage-gated potassium channel Kch
VIPRTVSTEITVTMINPPPPVPLTVVLSYLESDPYAVHAAFDVGLGRPVEWLFARDLLAAGLLGWTGAGDVRAGIDERGESLRIMLSAGHSAVFEFPADDVVGFLRRTYQLVPEGSERIDVDALVDQLTASGRLNEDAEGEK